MNVNILTELYGLYFQIEPFLNRTLAFESILAAPKSMTDFSTFRGLPFQNGSTDMQLRKVSKDAHNLGNLENWYGVTWGYFITLLLENHGKRQLRRRLEWAMPYKILQEIGQM